MREKIVAAATSVPALATLGVATTLGLLLHSAAIGGIGVVTACAFVALDLAKAKPQPKPSRLATSMLEPDRIRDAPTRAAVAAVVDARRGLARALAESPEALALDLASALVEVADLDARAAKLAGRSDDVATYLEAKDPAVLERELERLSECIARAHDPPTRSSYEEARAARGAELATRDELARRKDRIVATLLSIAASLDALTAKVVHLRDRDGDATIDVRRDLAALGDELAAFEPSSLPLHEGP